MIVPSRAALAESTNESGRQFDQGAQPLINLILADGFLSRLDEIPPMTWADTLMNEERSIVHSRAVTNA